VSAPATTESAAPDREARTTELTSLARTTPGVLIILTAVLIVVGIVVGIVTALSVQSRSTALDNLQSRSGPLSVAAQDIYRSLSDADATANSAFLSGGLEPTTLRARYEADIAQAESALSVAVAAREPGDLTDGSPLATLSNQLSVYTGIVETARALNHQGLPVGAAYQREASNLMRTQLLPAAQDLYRAETDQVAADQDDAAAFPVVELALGLLALAVLVVAQVYLRRHTNRVFNIGMLVATGAALVSLVWVVAATLGVSANVEDSRDRGSTQVDVLAQARIATLTARADETLTLVARGSGAEFEKHYASTAAHLAGDDGLLRQALSLATDDGVRERIQSAIDSQQAWHEIHQEIRKTDEDGNFTMAVQMVTGTDADGAAAQFDLVDADLRGALETTTRTFTDEVGQASNAITGTVAGVALLAVLMAVGAAVGIWQRLKEYR